MTLVAIDTNVLVYAEFESDQSKGIVAERLLEAISDRGLIPAQTIGEFLNVGRRRWPSLHDGARRQVEAYRAVFKIVPTDLDTLMAASLFAERYRLQFWDSVIWQASRKGGASILLTEDLQDGFEAEGMRALNPFIRPDWSTLAADLGI